jgi:hypothetical protein
MGADNRFSRSKAVEIIAAITFLVAMAMTVTPAFAIDLPDAANKIALNDSLTLEPDELYFMLPDDADRKNYKRQVKAVKKGFYWSVANTLKPLDFDNPLRK